MGIDVRQIPEEKTIILDQRHYAEAIMADCKLDEGRYKPTPLSVLIVMTPEHQCFHHNHSEHCALTMNMQNIVV